MHATKNMSVFHPVGANWAPCVSWGPMISQLSCATSKTSKPQKTFESLTWLNLSWLKLLGISQKHDWYVFKLHSVSVSSAVAPSAPQLGILLTEINNFGSSSNFWYSSLLYVPQNPAVTGGNFRVPRKAHNPRRDAVVPGDWFGWRSFKIEDDGSVLSLFNSNYIYTRIYIHYSIVKPPIYIYNSDYWISSGSKQRCNQSSVASPSLE